MNLENVTSTYNTALYTIKKKKIVTHATTLMTLENKELPRDEVPGIDQSRIRKAKYRS